MPSGNSPASPRRSWWQAYRLYKQHDGKGLVLFLKLGSVFLGLNVVDEPVPFLGQIDDPLFVPQLLFVLVLALFAKHHIGQYR